MPKVKKASITIKSVEDYLEMMNGFFGLTDKELKVLAEFVKEKIRRAQNDEDTDIHLFHHSVKRKIAKAMGKNNHYWINGYIMNLKQKDALIPLGEEGHYKITRALVPEGEQKIEIMINWDKDE